MKRAVSAPGASDVEQRGISQACVGDDVVYVSGQVSTATTLTGPSRGGLGGRRRPRGGGGRVRP